MSPYYINSNEYVPERVIEKIYKSTSSIMENGLNQFYESYSAFLFKLRGRTVIGDDIKHKTIYAHSVSMQGPLIMYLFNLILSLVVFMVEVIIHVITQRHHRN